MRLVNFCGFQWLKACLDMPLVHSGWLRACLDVLVVHFGDLSGLALALTFLLITFLVCVCVAFGVAVMGAQPPSLPCRALP